ncbi:MAG: hypothetical protein QW469_01185 [Candidatus Aenigmatarchaeota archaeon]
MRNKNYIFELIIFIIVLLLLTKLNVLSFTIAKIGQNEYMCPQVIVECDKGYIKVEDPCPRCVLDSPKLSFTPNIDFDPLFTWLKTIWNELLKLSPYSITGIQQPEVGSSQTYTIDIITTNFDDDYSDGKFQYQLGNWYLVKKDQTIVKSGDWEQIKNGRYTKTITITYPNIPEEYVLVGVIYSYDMQFNLTTGDWVIIKEDIIAKEAIGIKTKRTITSPITSNITLPSSSNILSRFQEWLLNLWKTLFGWLS